VSSVYDNMAGQSLLAGGDSEGPTGPRQYWLPVGLEYPVTSLYVSSDVAGHSLTIGYSGNEVLQVPASAMTFFNGGATQTAWSYLETAHPNQALNYRGLAYGCSANFGLGQSTELPQFSFEVVGIFANSVPVAGNETITLTEQVPESATIQVVPAGSSQFVADRSVVLTAGNEQLAAVGAPSPSNPFPPGPMQYAVLTGNLTASDGSVIYSPGTYFFSPDLIGEDVSITFTFAGLAYTPYYLDANPADVATDFLVNPIYGVGLPAGWVASLASYRAYCAAQGLLVSPAWTDQDQASEMMDDLVKYTNAEWVFRGGQLDIVPRGDVALSANGAVYTPPAPLYSLGDDDFIYRASEDPVTLDRKRPSDNFNVETFEFNNRYNGYNRDIVEAKDEGAINLFGLRPDDTQTAHFFCDPTIAATAAWLYLYRVTARNQYSFRLGWKYCLLDPMDIVEITDAALGLNQQWVRILSIEEDDIGNLKVTAEDVLQGTGTAALYSFHQTAGFQPDYGGAPGAMNPPLIFEPPLAISVSGQLEVWMALSGQSANYGGCDVWVSFDGASYGFAGRARGNARQGVLIAPLPASAAASDTANDILLGLLAPGAQLLSGSALDAALTNTACWVDGEIVAYTDSQLIPPTGGSATAQPLGIGDGATTAFQIVATAGMPVESFVGSPAIYVSGAIQSAGIDYSLDQTGLVTFYIPPANGAVVSWTGAYLWGPPPRNVAISNSYALANLNRGLYGTPNAAHAIGAAFARLDGAIFTVPIPPAYIGAPVWIKLLPYNQYGGGQPDLAAVQPYNYRITGNGWLAPLANVTGLASSVGVNGAPIISWLAVSDALRTVDYEVRFGASWQAGQVLGRTTSTLFACPSDGTYWVAAHARSPQGVDVYSATPACIVQTLPTVPAVQLYSQTQESAGWPGWLDGGAFINDPAGGPATLELAAAGNILTLVDVLIAGDILWLGGVQSSGGYFFSGVGAGELGLGSVASLLFVFSYTLAGISIYGNLLSCPDFLGWTDVFGAALGGAVSVTPQVAFGDTGGGLPAWQNWTLGKQYNCNFGSGGSSTLLMAQILLASSDPQVRCVVSHLTVTVYALDQTQAAQNVPVIAAGTTLSFNQPFNTGPGGSAVPNVQVTILGASSGDTAIITGRTAISFSVHVLNAGTGVARSIDWLATGF
jgi:hypothetical protein